jgi:hypothetical protein
VADDGEGLAGLDAEGDVAEDPVVFAGIGNGAIAEPHVAEFDFTAWIFEANGVGRRGNVGGLIEQLENALGSGHGGLQDVEFFAEVLDGAEEARGEHREHRQNAQTEGPGKHAIAAGPVDEGDGSDAENFDGGIKEGVGEDGIAPREHVLLIALGEFGAGFLLAIEQLHDAHPGDVFLQEGVDSRDGGADVAVGVAHVMAEDEGDDQDAGEDGKGVQCEAPIDFEKHRGHHGEEEKVVNHGDHAGGEEIVESVDVGGDAGDQPADGVAVVVGHRQALQVREDSGAHVVHGLLADALHDANLDVLGEKIENQDQQVDDADDSDAAPCAAFRQAAAESGRKIVINSPAKNYRRTQLQRSDDGHQGQRQDDAPFVRPHVLHQAAHQARIVGFAECFFFVHVAHARSSSSSSNCFWYKSA